MSCEGWRLSTAPFHAHYAGPKLLTTSPLPKPCQHLLMEAIRVRPSEHSHVPYQFRPRSGKQFPAMPRVNVVVLE